MMKKPREFWLAKRSDGLFMAYEEPCVDMSGYAGALKAREILASEPDFRALAEDLFRALENANGFTSCITEDMEYYFDNKCYPTSDKVNQCAIDDSEIRIALARYRDEMKKQTEEKK